MLSPAEDMRGRIEADTSSSTLEEEFPPDLLEKTRGDKERHKHTLVLMWQGKKIHINFQKSLATVEERCKKNNTWRRNNDRIHFREDNQGEPSEAARSLRFQFWSLLHPFCQGAIESVFSCSQHSIILSQERKHLFDQGQSLHFV